MFSYFGPIGPKMARLCQNPKNR